MEETLESLCEQIDRLWTEHYDLPFPEGLADEENGIDLLSLDSYIAGCVSTFIDRGDLDVGRTAVLGICYGEVVAVRASIDHEGNEYFGRLEKLAELVLRSVVMKNNELP